MIKFYFDKIGSKTLNVSRLKAICSTGTTAEPFDFFGRIKTRFDHPLVRSRYSSELYLGIIGAPL
ncbi:MAG: hypothetical protein IPO62_08025 [Saprospiraceae bacterium]|nr:hypothetical protein [Saprospiraceae bacterium]MBK9631000.1 hypothetical protein [Saprospiraceae bacterium]